MAAKLPDLIVSGVKNESAALLRVQTLGCSEEVDLNRDVTAILNTQVHTGFGLVW